LQFGEQESVHVVSVKRIPSTQEPHKMLPDPEKQVLQLPVQARQFMLSK
jgi:hypothetical protein